MSYRSSVASTLRLSYDMNRPVAFVLGVGLLFYGGLYAGLRLCDEIQCAWYYRGNYRPIHIGVGIFAFYPCICIEEFATQVYYFGFGAGMIGLPQIVATNVTNSPLP